MLIRRFLTATCACAGLAACSGGSASPPPLNTGARAPATPTPAPTPLATATPVGAGVTSLGFASPGGGHGGGQCPAGSPAWGCPSTYALTSDPSGVSVQRFDPSGQTTKYNVTLTTPANDALPDSSTNLQYRFASSSAAGPFVVAVQQVHDGPHQVYYNRNADSSGTVDASQLQSVRRGLPLGTRGPRVAGELVRSRSHARAGVRDDRLYVRFRNAALRASRRTVDDAIRALGTTGVELATTNADPLAVVRVPAGTGARAYAAQLASRSDVAATFPVRERHALSKQPTTPNDPDFILPNEWYLFATGFPYAWSYTNGTGATIAVIDTGVDLTNADIAANVAFSETVLNGSRSTSITDTDGHGTDVAGIAGALANNGASFGSGNHNFAGGGWSAKLIAIGVFGPSSDTASASDEAIAIGDAVSHHADVINLSIGAPESFNDNQYADPSSWNGGYDEGEYEAIQAAIASGVTVVAASGNDADGTDTSGDGYQHGNLDYPAGYDNVVSVGASQLNDASSGVYGSATESVATYSQYGAGLSVVAPGGNASGGSDTDILHWIWNYYSTAATQPCTYGNGTLAKIPTNCTALFTGTSQATAQVSAAAALLYAAAGGHGSLKPAQVKQLIEQTADNINDPHQGHGRLNAYRALASLVGDIAAPTGPQSTKHGAAQAIAFAYANSGANRPVILDYDYPVGVPVASNGSFRIADVRRPDATSFKIGVWLDVNGDGIIDAGDYFALAASGCTTSAPCAIGTVVMQPVTGAFALP